MDNFLHNCRVFDNIYTHISLTNGKYNIPDEKIDEFYTKLSSTDKRYCLVEKHLDDKSFFIIDFDFKSYENIRLITDKIIKDIIETINIILDKIFINHNKIVYILQRNNIYKKDDYYKDGIHIIYPKIVCKYNLLYLLRDLIIEELDWLEKYSITKIDDIIDESVIKKNGLVMYNCIKPGLEPYNITKIYDNNLNELNNTYSNKELLYMLSIRTNNNISEIILTDEQIDDMLNIDNDDIDDDTNEYDNVKDILNNIEDKNVLQYILFNILNKSRADNYNDWIKIGFCLYNISSNNLDLWIEFSKLSNKYKKGECEKLWYKMQTPIKPLKLGTLYYYSMKDNKDKIKDLIIVRTIDSIKNDFPNNNLKINKILRDNNYIYIDMMDKYCPILKNSHIESSNYFEITPKSGIIMKCKNCNCIGKIYPNDKDIYVSINNINNIFNITINNYNTVSNEPIDEDSIKLEVMNITEDTELNELLTETLNCTNGKIYDLANILHYLFKNQFRFDSINKDWYYFETKWKKCNNKLRTKISNEIVSYYKKMNKIITKEYNEYKKINNININKDNEYKYKIKKIDNLIGELKTTAFKNNIIKEAEEIFTDNHDNIIHKLDDNMYLLAFDNGVYDIKAKIFRDIKPDDYISMSVGYNYISETDVNYDKNIENKLITFLEEIHPDKTQRDYLLTYLSTCIVGLNLLQHFVIFLGNGYIYSIIIKIE